MKFIDEATITVRSGRGGPGSISFRREKFVPMGGPDGGHGGEGGDVILVTDKSVHTLLDFHFKPEWAAGDGEKGHGRRSAGKDGEDLIIKLPIGTQVYRITDPNQPGELVVDLTEENQRFVLAKGGRGGQGNEFFKTATRQAPDYAQPGEEGQSGTYLLSLKLVADVALIGFPNAGKSTLIARISAARPKIADYPFTTLTPNLGVARTPSGGTLVIADIPGLIPGAHEGKGLGIKFLKHIERTRVLVHLIDPHQLRDDGTPMPPMEAFEAINTELREYSSELAQRPQIVAINKADTVAEPGELEPLRQEFEKRGHRAVVISGVSGYGVDSLLRELDRHVKSSQG